MITYKAGDLFQSNCQTLVNATNIEGVMGGGIALGFKQRYPDMYNEYVLACQNGTHTTLRPHLWKNTKPFEKWVLNIATKDYIKNYSTLANVSAGLSWLVEYYKTTAIQSIALPALGCGLGGLDWRKVQPIMHGFLDILDIPVEVYVPHV